LGGGGATPYPIVRKRGSKVMALKYRLSLLSLFVPALYVAGGCADAEAQEARRWSDPATWPSGKVPSANDAVTIDNGMNVILDVSPPALRSLTINGKLSFSNDADLELITEWIMLHGELAIGSESSPHTRKATITLT